MQYVLQKTFSRNYNTEQHCGDFNAETQQGILRYSSAEEVPGMSVTRSLIIVCFCPLQEAQPT